MIKNIIIGVLVITTLIFVGLYFSNSKNLGAVGIGMNHYQSENFIQGLTLGNGTILAKSNCSTGSKTFGSIAVSATTTIDIALPGATTAKRQVYFGGIATSSAFQVQVTVAPSSTGYVSATLRNLGTAWNVVTSTVSVCYLQF